MAVTNGDFETGDFTGWTQDGAGSYVLTVGAGWKHAGVYGAQLRGNPGETTGWCSIAQNIGTLNTTTTISIWCKKINTSGGPAQYKVTASGFDSDWQDLSGSWGGDYTETTTSGAALGLTEETADCTLTIKCSAIGGGYTEIYVDDITLGTMEAPIAEFSHAAGSNTLEITFTDESTNAPTEWDWDFGDTTSGSTQNPIHEYASPKLYTVSLTATNAAGGSTPHQEQFQVYGSTTIPFTHGTIEYTQGETLTITDEHTFTTPTTSYKIYAYWTAGSANLTDTGTGGESGATCVLSWVESVHDALYILTLTSVSGTFTDGEIITFSDGVHNTGYYEFDRNYQVSIELPATSYRTPQAGDTVLGVTSGHTGTVTGVSQSGGRFTIFISSDGGFDGENVTLTPSGGATTVTGELDTVTLTGGSYEDGTAYGTITLINTTDEVPPGYISGTTSGGNVGYTGGEYQNYTNSGDPYIIVTGDSDPLNFTSASVSKQITDACWKAEVNIPKEYVPPITSDMPIIMIVAPDHNNVNQTIFYGIVTNIKYKQTPVGLTTTLICYDYAYYLTCQYVPIKTTMYSSSGSVYSPDQVVKRFLGTDTSATDYDHVTGIYPLNIDSVTGWGSSTVPSKAFDWTHKTRKWSALQDITDYTDYILYIFWKYNDPTTNDWCPVAYFVDATDIDTSSPLDLPSMVTCTASTDPYLVNEITTVNQDEFRYNSVKIYGEDSDGLSIVGSSSAENVGDTIKPIEYIEENNDYKTQTLVDSVADSYLTYLNIPGDVYTCTFAKRSDLRLLQKIQFLGYDQVPEEEMRISGITYVITPGDIRVTCTVTTDRKFNSARKLKKVLLPSVFSALSGALQQKLNEERKAMLVTVTGASSGSYIVEDNDGKYFAAIGPS